MDIHYYIDRKLLENPSALIGEVASSLELIKKNSHGEKQTQAAKEYHEGTR
jgi:hypothetical protein